MFQLTGTPF